MLEHVEWMLAAAGVGLCASGAAVSFRCLVRRGGTATRMTLVLLGVAVASVAGCLCVRGARTGRFPAFGFHEALSLYALALLATYLFISRRHRMRGLSLVLAPYATVLLAAGVTAMRQPVAVPPEAGRFWIEAHVCAAFFAYALCTVSALLGAVYLVQDNNLKRKRFGACFEMLPALEALDHMMARQIGAAFLMLTVAVGLGVHLVRIRGGGAEWATDPKIVATSVTWVTYAVLMHMRTSRTFHGRRMALVTLAGLLLVLFSFLGIHLVARSRHDFVLLVVSAL